MKFYPIILSLLLFAVSCQDSEPGDEEKAGQDTPNALQTASNQNGMDPETKAAAVDAAIDSIQKANRKVPVKRVDHRTYSDKDALGILEADGKLFRVVDRYFPPGEENMSMFYQLDGRVVLFKKRQWVKEGLQPFAKEISCYMDEKGIYKSLERRVLLSEGQNPSGVLSAPPAELTLKQDSLHRAILADFKKLQKMIAENK